MSDPVGLSIEGELLERLVKKHFGSEHTAKLTWNVLRNRYARSDVPERLAAPQTLFGIPVWWKVLGEFRTNLGFHLDLWDAAHLGQARALVEEFNATTAGEKLDLSPIVMHFPASPAPIPAPGE